MTIDFIEKYFEHHIAPFYLKSPALHNYEIMHSKDIEKCRNFMDYSITIKTRKVAASLHKEPHPEDPSSPSHTYTQLSSKSIQLSPRHVCVCVCVRARQENPGPVVPPASRSLLAQAHLSIVSRSRKRGTTRVRCGTKTHFSHYNASSRIFFATLILFCIMGA